MAQLVEHDLAKVGVAGSNPSVALERNCITQFLFRVIIILIVKMCFEKGR